MIPRQGIWHTAGAQTMFGLRVFAALTLWLKYGLSTFPQVIRTERKKVKIAKDPLLSDSHLEVHFFLLWTKPACYCSCWLVNAVSILDLVFLALLL